jgi:hypothetical protein
LASHLSFRILSICMVLSYGDASALFGHEIRHHEGGHDVDALWALNGLMASIDREASVDDGGRCRMKAWASSRR